MMLSCALGYAGKKEKAPKEPKAVNVTQRVYLYGLSTSFNDSLVYVTEIQAVDSAYIQRKKFLGGAKEYVEQMHQYFNGNVPERRTNTVFHYLTREKAEKAFLKLRKQYEKNGMEFLQIPNHEFMFTAVKED